MKSDFWGSKIKRLKVPLMTSEFVPRYTHKCRYIYHLTTIAFWGKILYGCLYGIRRIKQLQLSSGWPKDEGSNPTMGKWRKGPWGQCQMLSYIFVSNFSNPGNRPSYIFCRELDENGFALFGAIEIYFCFFDISQLLT